MAVSRKKIATSVLALFLVLLVGGAAVLYQRLSDVDEIRKIIVKKLEETSGREVHVGGAALDFEKGIGLRLTDVVIGGEFRGHPRLGADSLWVVVKVLPLLRKKVEIRKLVLQGAQVQLIRDADGRWNFAALVDRLSERTPPEGGGLMTVFKVSFIKRVVIQGGRVKLYDFKAGTEQEPVEMGFDSVQLSLRKDFFQPSYKFDLQVAIPHPEHPGSMKAAGKLQNVLSLSGASIALEGQVAVDDFAVSGLKPYFQEWVPAVPKDARLGLHAKFSGEWGGASRSSGTLKYTSRSPDLGPALRAPAHPRQGVLDYDIAMDRKRNVDLKAFHLQSGPFEVSGEGRLSGLEEEQPKVSFAISTRSFRVSESRDVFPLNVLLTPRMHELLQKRLSAGKVEFQSLKFDGTLEELKNLDARENLKRLFVRLSLEDIDLGDPLPPLKGISGTLVLENGTQTIHLSRGVYAGFPLTDVRGTVKDAVHAPVIDIEVENQVDTGRLHAALMELFGDDPIKKSIEDYQDLAGPSILRLHLKGPLGDPDEILLEAGLRFVDVSLHERGFAPRIEHLKGTIFCVRSPASATDKPPLLRFEDLSGEFGGSSFSRLNGELRVDGDSPERTLSALYTLGPAELPGVLADLSLDPPFDDWGGRLTFDRGVVEVDYHAFGNPETPELEKEWGTITLRDISARYMDDKAAFHNLTGSADFSGKGIVLKEVLGWFGESPFHLEGEVKTPDDAPPDFALHLITNSLKSADLAPFPALSSIAFEGLAALDLKVNGNELALTFANELDLTDAAYSYGERFVKKRGASQVIAFQGAYAKKQGMRFDNIDIHLGKNRVSGRGRISNLEEGAFTIDLAAKNLALHPAGQFVVPFKDCRGGTLSFDVRGEGRLDRLSDARWNGAAKVDAMQLRPERFLHTLAIDTEVKFSGRKIEVPGGVLKSDRSNVRFKGEGELGSTLNLDLKLTGERLVVDELLPEPDEPAVDFKTYMRDSPFFSRGTGRVQFALDRLNFKFLDLKNASGLFTLAGGEFKVNTLDIGKNKEILVRGVVSLEDSEEGTIRGLIQAKDTRVEHFMDLFGDMFKGGLSGQLKKLDMRFQSKGKGMPTLGETLEAKWLFDISNGKIDTGKLRQGAVRLFGTGGTSLGSGAEDAKSRLKPFTQIAGKFELAKGIAETEKFVYETGERRTSVVGKFDLVKHELDLIAGVAPMASLDKFLTKIPVVGKIITGGDEESLVKAYFSVKGGFDDPQVNAIPFTSLSRKVMGIFQGIFQTPGALFPSQDGTGK